MPLIIVILNQILAAGTILWLQEMQLIQMIKLFGVPSVFVLKFFGELILFFLVSALISHLLKIDKASEE